MLAVSIPKLADFLRVGRDRHEVLGYGSIALERIQDPSARGRGVRHGFQRCKRLRGENE